MAPIYLRRQRVTITCLVYITLSALCRLNTLSYSTDARPQRHSADVPTPRIIYQECELICLPVILATCGSFGTRSHVPSARYILKKRSFFTPRRSFIPKRVRHPRQNAEGIPPSIPVWRSPGGVQRASRGHAKSVWLDFLISITSPSRPPPSLFLHIVFSRLQISSSPSCINKNRKLPPSS